ncbi:hypothetical protein DM02DRAFT_283180 [Periconia macrospinosa]|uniref:Uncharacterized protein n=1 Tax=Periconia macrospinosa TaxID=97972 RepID=A0A2V1EBQ3_9PLEO|nr:hypothetical protein DM02DRAFT_283180 [Periconia macrospinosa]
MFLQQRCLTASLLVVSVLCTLWVSIVVVCVCVCVLLVYCTLRPPLIPLPHAPNVNSANQHLLSCCTCVLLSALRCLPACRPSIRPSPAFLHFALCSSSSSSSSSSLLLHLTLSLLPPSCAQSSPSHTPSFPI